MEEALYLYEICQMGCFYSFDELTYITVTLQIAVLVFIILLRVYYSGTGALGGAATPYWCIPNRIGIVTRGKSLANQEINSFEEAPRLLHNESVHEKSF